MDTTVTVQFGDVPQPQPPGPYAGGVMGSAVVPVLVPSPMPPGRVRISSGVMAGLLIKRVYPVRPALAREQHVSGAVVLHVVI